MEYTGAKALRNKFFDKGSKVPKYSLTKDNSVLVFPFEITLGAINSTAEGLRSLDNVNVTDYSAFQRLFTGLENIIALWEGAYKVEKENANDNFLKKTHQVGRSFRGYVAGEERAATFAPSSVSPDFLAEFTEETFTIHTYEELSEEDLFKFYIIPELKEFKWLYVADAQIYRDSKGQFHHSELTLRTLNNLIAKSGRAVEAFVHRSAPGEGYAFPVVDADQKVIVDTKRERDVPVTSIQVEMSGPAAFGNVFAYGRPTKTETNDGITKIVFNDKIEAPRILLPNIIETPVPSPTNTRPSAETDYYIGKFKPTLEDYFENYKKQFQASFDPSMRAQFEGVLEAIDKLEKVQRSNPINEGSHQYTLWDPTWRPEVDKTYNVQSDKYTAEKLVLKGTMSLAQILSHNIFGLSPISTLPLSVKQNISWSLADIPLIGGFLSKITFGIPIGWRETAVRVSMDDVLLVQPASLIEYGNVLQGRSPDAKDTKPQIDLSTYTTENKDEAIEFSGINATGTIFKVGITHRFTKVINGETYTFDTIDLGQVHPTKDDNGKDVTGNIPAILYWDETCIPTDRGDTPGYVIDATSFKAIAKLDYRLTAFSNSTEVWSGTYQTNAKFTGSIRDWTNYTKMSNWKEDNDRIVDYPATIVDPTPPNVQQPAFDFPVSEVPAIETEYFKDIGLSDFLVIENAFGRYFITERGRKWYQRVGTIPGKPDPNENTLQTKDTEDYVYENVITNFDTKPYGGINNFKNNYKEIDLTISGRTRRAISKSIQKTQIDTNKTFIKINIDELVTKGLIETELFNNNYNEQRWLDDKTIFVTGNLIKNIKNVKIKLKLTIDGDIIKVIAVSEYKTIATQNIINMTNEWSNTPNEHSGTNVIDAWFNVDKATTVPIIVRPNQGGK